MYSYNENVKLTFPTNHQLRTYYEVYTGGFTSFDDGFANDPIALPDLFYMNGLYYNEFYMNTNGVLYFQNPSSDWETSPNNDYTINGNVGDLYIQPGFNLNDNSRSGVYYKKTTHSMGGYSMEIAVNCGFYDDESTPGSYLINLHRDTKYQYVVIMSKSNPTSDYNEDNDYHAGPYSDPDVTQTNSTNSQVWRSDLEGNNWEYLGTGSVEYVVPVVRTCGVKGCGTRIGKVCLLSKSSCTCAQYKYFYPRCSRIQQALGICNGLAGAWVPAITVCSQKLF